MTLEDANIPKEIYIENKHSVFPEVFVEKVMMRNQFGFLGFAGPGTQRDPTIDAFLLDSLGGFALRWSLTAQLGVNRCLAIRHKR
jgi:hypothetical protein